MHAWVHSKKECLVLTCIDGLGSSVPQNDMVCQNHMAQLLQECVHYVNMS